MSRAPFALFGKLDEEFQPNLLMQLDVTDVNFFLANAASNIILFCRLCHPREGKFGEVTYNDSPQFQLLKIAGVHWAQHGYTNMIASQVYMLETFAKVGLPAMRLCENKVTDLVAQALEEFAAWKDAERKIIVKTHGEHFGSQTGWTKWDPREAATKLREEKRERVRQGEARRTAEKE